MSREPKNAKNFWKVQAFLSAVEKFVRALERFWSFTVNNFGHEVGLAFFVKSGKITTRGG